MQDSGVKAEVLGFDQASPAHVTHRLGHVTAPRTLSLYGSSPCTHVTHLLGQVARGLLREAKDNAPHSRCPWFDGKGVFKLCVFGSDSAVLVTSGSEEEESRLTGGSCVHSST
eukprot:1231402-Rhodomonas_salina.1